MQFLKGAILRIARFLDRANSIANTGSNGFSAALALILMIMMAIDVVGRKFFDSPLVGAREYGTTLIIFIFYLAFARTLAKGEHIRIEVITGHFGPRVRVGLELLAGVLGFSLFGIFAWLGGKWAWETIFVTKEIIMGPVDFPFWPSRAAYAVGCLLLCTQFLSNIVKSAARLIVWET